MGDCGNIRCVQEKRHFKKELASWYKKVPFSIGLELVAENIAGNASGHIKTLLLPFNDMELEETEDFQPELESPCIFCQGQPSVDSSEQENIPEMISVNEHTTHSQLSKGTSEQRCHPCNGTTADSTSANNAVPELPVLEGLNSFYNQLAMTSLMYQQQQLQSAAVQAALTAGTASSSQRQPTISSLGMHQSADIALDLRSEPLDVSNSLSTLTAEPGSIKVPEIRSKKKKDNSIKRSYTDRELNAAVDAIKSGTIGTRRAAQLYGVPRSTLRNKVFKSGEMSRQLPYNQEHFSGAADALDENCDSPPPKSNSDSESSSPNSKQTSPHQGKASEEQASDMSQYSSALMKQLEELQAKHGINEQLNMMTQQSRLIGDMFNPLQFAATSYPFFMPQYSALTAMPGLDYMNPYASSMLMPYLPEMMKNLAQKQLEIERIGHSSAHRQPTSSRKPEQSPTVTHPKKEDIKVPAYKPSTNHMSSEHDVTAKVAKSTIRKDNDDKMSEVPSAFTTADYLQKMISQSPSTSKRTSPLTSHTPRKKSFNEQSHSQVQPSHSISNGNSSGKKRPKRGQYRKYDSERLADAVKAVQRGEMSVHRAGTHYGVPHSTLEYKVKERHLLRKKKIAENGESKLNTSAALGAKPPATNVACNNSTDVNQSASKVSPASPKLAVGESIQKAGATDNNTPGFLDFSPSSYHMDAPASELLMKLHAKAHQRANEIINGAKSRGTSESKDNLSNLV